MLCEQVGEAFTTGLVSGQKPLPYDLDIPVMQKTAKIVYRHVVDIGCVIPPMRKLFRHRHPSTETVS